MRKVTGTELTRLPKYSAPIPSLPSLVQTRIPKRQKRSRTLRIKECIYGAFAGTTLVMPNAIEGRREEVGGLVEAGVLRVEINVLVLQVLGGLAMTGLASVRLKQRR
jgi:hypothetical protein